MTTPITAAAMASLTEGKLERVVQARRGLAAGPAPGGDPRGDQPDDDGEHDREHRLERDARPARHQRRDEHDPRPQGEQARSGTPRRAGASPGTSGGSSAANARTARRAAPRRRPPARAQTRPSRRCQSHVAREPDRVAQQNRRPTGSVRFTKRSCTGNSRRRPHSGSGARYARRQMSGRTTCETLLIRSARSSSNSLATA